MIKRIVLIILILSLNSYADNFGNLKQYFANEESLGSILYINGYAHLNLIGGFADGRYKLKSYSIKSYAKNIYILHIVVEKKKHYFRYIRKFDIPFFYNGRIIAFKTVKGKRIYRFPQDSFDVIKTKEGWKFIMIKSKIDVKLPIESGYMFITIIKP